MLRVLFFLLLLIIPAVFSWWLFVPLALLYVYLGKFPFEIIAASLLLDSVYYFGSSLLWYYPLTLYSLILLLLAYFLNRFIHWRKVI